MNLWKRILPGVLLTAGFAAGMNADVRLPSILSDRMLLQQKVKVPVWGKADPGEQITVTFAGQKKTGKADAKGDFKIYLDPLTASAEDRDMVVEGRNRIIIRNVLVGEVWFCGGQSNMDFWLDGNRNSKEERLAANYPKIRLFYVNRAISRNKEMMTRSRWKECVNWGAATFSAVGYFFGRELYQQLGLPIGLIDSSYGGSPIEPWISTDKFQKTPAIRQKLADIKGGDKGNRGFALGYADPKFDDSAWQSVKLPDYGKEHKRLMKTEGEFFLRKTIEVPADWKGKADVMNLGWVHGVNTVYINGKKVFETDYTTGFWWERWRSYRTKFDLPAGKVTIALRVFGTDVRGNKEFNILRYDNKVKKPVLSLAGEWKFKEVYTLPESEAKHIAYIAMPGQLCNAMVAPCQPFPIRGVIWYQGESNTGKANEYETLFRAMAEDWREKWECGNFPIYLVQLPGYIYGGNWPQFRLVQEELTKKIPNVDMTVNLDIGDPKDIHPRQKKPFGLRLANLALKKTYGKNVHAKGPFVRSIRKEGDRIRVSFDTEFPLVLRSGTLLQGFEAGFPGGKFQKVTDAKIDGNGKDVILSGIPTSVYVRYGWGAAPVCNLADKQGLPAAPFLKKVRE